MKFFRRSPKIDPSSGLLSSVQFGSLLVYSPKGTSEVSRSSRTACYAVKDDKTIPGAPPGEVASEYSIRRLAEEIAAKKAKCLERFFGEDVLVVPAPKSGLTLPSTFGKSLWVPYRLCEEIKRRRLAGRVAPLIQRIKAVPSSKMSPPGQRPTARVHLGSFVVDKSIDLAGVRRILIVDDVVTKGNTLLACASKLRSFVPDAEISTFALIRTISKGEIEKMLEPTAGDLVLCDGYNSERRP